MVYFPGITRISKFVDVRVVVFTADIAATACQRALPHHSSCAHDRVPVKRACSFAILTGPVGAVVTKLIKEFLIIVARRRRVCGGAFAEVRAHSGGRATAVIFRSSGRACNQCAQCIGRRGWMSDSKRCCQRRGQIWTSTDRSRG